MRCTATLSGRHSIGTAALVALACTLFGGDALAKSAKRMLLEANRLFAAGQYRQAYEVYEQGNKAGPRPVFLRSMGFCKLKLFRHGAAKKLFQEYLSRYPEAKDVDKIAETVKTLSVIAQTKVKVETVPAGAVVFVDTQATTSRGQTPVTITVEPGRHRLILRHPDYRTTIREFRIQPKQTIALRAEMELPLEVRSVPAGAKVYVDTTEGPALGETPVEVGIIPGKRTLYLRKSGFQTWRGTVDAKVGKETTVEARLKIPVQLTSIPSGARIHLDGVLLAGRTPRSIGVLPGKHQVVYSLSGFSRLTHNVEIAPVQPNKVQGRFRGGVLDMRSIPSGAKVSVGSLAVGRTPLSAAIVPLGVQRVRAAHAQRRPWSAALNFATGQRVSAELRLGRPIWPVWAAAVMAGASLAVGIGVGLAAKSKTDSANDSQRYAALGSNQSVGQGLCSGGGSPLSGFRDSDGDGAADVAIAGSDCSQILHHTSTAGFVTAGIAGVFSLAYYWFFVRPELRVNRSPLRSATSTR